MPINGLVAGIRSDGSTKIYGDDLDELRRLSDEVQKAQKPLPLTR